MSTANSPATTYSAGRPPWFDLNLSGKVSFKTSEAMVIGISGGSASGKTSVSEYTRVLDSHAKFIEISL